MIVDRLRLALAALLLVPACGDGEVTLEMGAPMEEPEGSSSSGEEPSDDGPGLTSTSGHDPGSTGEPEAESSSSSGDESEGGSSSGDESSTGEPCDVSCRDLALDVLPECPQIADGSPDHGCIAEMLPPACVVDELAGETEACLFSGDYPEDCELPSLAAICVE